jgi:hypothetical protein
MPTWMSSPGHRDPAIFDTFRHSGKNVVGRRRFRLKQFRHQVIALAGLMLLLPLAALRSAPAAQAKAPSKEQIPAGTPEKQQHGPKDMADGQIKSVTCKGRALDMAFDDSYEILHLRTDNYFKVDFSAINFKFSGIMNPCKTAKGMYARVYYYDIKGHPKQGDLISVEFRK